ASGKSSARALGGGPQGCDCWAVSGEAAPCAACLALVRGDFGCPPSSPAPTALISAKQSGATKVDFVPHTSLELFITANSPSIENNVSSRNIIPPYIPVAFDLGASSMRPPSVHM